MNLADIIPLNNIYLDVNASSKKALFKEVAAKIADKLKWEMPATVDDPMVFEDIKKKLDELRQ